MSTPPFPPPPPGGPGAPPPPPRGAFPPGDPRNNMPYDASAWRDAQRAWGKAQKEQSKAWRDYNRDAAKQQSRAMRDQARFAAEAQRNQVRAWRRANRVQSLVGPLLLIGFAVAVLLVYRGHLSSIAMLTWFSRWWPLVLIAAGLIRVAEYLYARSTASDRAVPARFVLGGGTVTLLVVLSIFGLSSQGLLRASNDGVNFTPPFLTVEGDNGLARLFGSRHEEDAAEITRAVAANGTVEIYNSRGDVAVDGSSTDGMVHLSQHRSTYAANDAEATSRFNELTPQFSGNDQSLTVRVTGPDTSTSTLTVQVPAGVRVLLNTNRGDVRAAGIGGALTVNANRGDVTVNGAGAGVQVHTNSRHGSVQLHDIRGVVEVNGTGDEINLDNVAGTVHVGGTFFGGGRLQHIAGQVNYDAERISFSAREIAGEIAFDSGDEFTARDVVGPINVATRSRKVTLERVAGDVHVTDSSGDVQIVAMPPNGTITVANRDGDVRVSLPANAKFTVAAETSDGSITNEFPGASGTVGQSAKGALSGSVGGGGPMIHLMTTHGNIALVKNTEVSGMPAMPQMPDMPKTPSADVLLKPAPKAPAPPAAPTPPSRRGKNGKAAAAEMEL